MRKTKVICTIGPASENEATLTKMFAAGMNVARLNFSHGAHEEHKKKIDLIKKVREQMDLPVAIMLDTKGPEYRIRTFAGGSVTLSEGDTFTFTTDEVEGDETRVSVNYKGLVSDLSVGDRITVNNGMVAFEVRELHGSDVVCQVLTGGVLSNKKSMSFPIRSCPVRTSRSRISRTSCSASKTMWTMSRPRSSPPSRMRWTCAIFSMKTAAS